MTPNDVREMDYFDFQVHLRLCLASERVDHEHKAMLAGFDVKSSSTSSATSTGQKQYVFDPNTSKFSKTKQPVEKIYQKYDPKTMTLIGENHAD